MKEILTTCTLILLWVSTSAQVLTLTDKDTGQPIDLAVISSKEPPAIATTNGHGQADITEFQGADSIRIQLIGYQTIVISYRELASAGFELGFEQTSISLDQVVVSASRWNQPQRDIPSKISMISRSEVAMQNPQTAADLLGSSGEVFIQKSQLGGGSPMIRGFSTNRLLIAVDGIRMNSAIFRSGNLQNVIALDPLAIEHTEVFFGPGSVIYGSDAIGGLMSFQTLPPELSLFDRPLVSGKGVARYSTATREKTGHFDINIGWKRWAITTSVTLTDYDDPEMGVHGPDEYLRNWYVESINGIDSLLVNRDPRRQVPAGYSQLNLMQKVRFRPSERLDLVYGFHYSTTSDVPRYDRLTEMRNGLPRSAEWYYGPQGWMMHNLSLTIQSRGRLFDVMTTRVAFQRFGESRNDRNFRSVTLRKRNEKVNAYSLNMDFNKKINDRNQLFYGVEGVFNDVSSTGSELDTDSGAEVPGPARYPNSTWASFGVYGTYQYRFSDKALIQGGARYSMFTLHSDFDTTFYPFPFTSADITNGALTGSVGIIIHPREESTISLNVSTGFRSPNVDDIGKVFDSQPGSVVVPNPDLRAEYAYNFELGLARVFGERFKVDLSAYYTILDNALVRRPYTLNGADSIIYDGELSRVEAIQNAAMARVYGIQAGVEVKFGAGFGLTSTFSYQIGEEELDDGSVSPSRHAAPAFGATHLTFKRKKLNLDFYATYSARRLFEDMPEEEKGKTHIYATDENGNPWSPGWYTINVKGMYQFTDFLAVTIGLENLTNQRYRPYSSGIVANGFNAIAAVRVTF